MERHVGERETEWTREIKRLLRSMIGIEIEQHREWFSLAVFSCVGADADQAGVQLRGRSADQMES